MPLGNSGYYIPAPWLVLAEFFVLFLLAYCLVLVIQLESRFQSNRERLLHDLKMAARSLRSLRLQTQSMQTWQPGLILNASGRRQWRFLSVVLKILSLTKRAHS